MPAFALSSFGAASRKFAKSAKSGGVPRAVFLGLLRIAPGGLTFQAQPLTGVERLSTAVAERGR